MNQSIHSLRLLFCFFSGEDDFIIRKCNRHIQFYFAAIGSLVLFAFVLCWLSAAIFMSHVFAGAKWLSIPISVLWAILVTNLYLLLLYTISPALLPVAPKRTIANIGKEEKTEKKRTRTKYLLFSFSFLARVSFIVFIAIVVAQPFNVYFFSSGYNEAERFAASIQKILQIVPLARFITAMFCIIMLLPIFLKYRVRAISRKYFDQDFEETNNKDMYYLREQLGNTTDHQTLARHILSVDINAVRTSDFYFQKTLIEYRIVLEEYRKFKKLYSKILSERIIGYNHKYYEELEMYLNKLKNINPEQYRRLSDEIKRNLSFKTVEKYEYWADPPFRTTYKSAIRKLATEEELLKIFYPEK